MVAEHTISLLSGGHLDSCSPDMISLWKTFAFFLFPPNPLSFETGKDWAIFIFILNHLSYKI